MSLNEISEPLEAPQERGQNALDILLRGAEAGGGGDFPALSQAVGAINRITASEREGVNALSNNILNDFALTNKLLKLANVAFYSQVGGGSISTISRAVVVLGFDAVRSIALSLILFDNLENKAHAQELKEEFVKVLYAGMLARELAERTQVRNAEEAFIGAMLHKLGRMLAMFYFPAEIAEIRARIQSWGATEARASIDVLGVSYENLGIGVARSWGFPDTLVQSMKALPEGRLPRAASEAERLRAVSGFANALCEVILETPQADHAKAVKQLAARFGDVVPVTAEQLMKVMEKSMQDIAAFASVVRVNLKGSEFARQAAQWAGMKSAPGAAVAVTEDALDENVLHEHAPVLDAEPLPAAARCTSEEIQAVLAAGLQDVSNSLIDDTISINDVLRMILEAMYSGMGFDRVVLCIKDGRRNAMCGKFGFGQGVEDLVKTFDFPLTAPPDVFLVALQNNADILITDIDDPKIATRIPAWFRRHVVARTFVLFPIVVKGKPIGLIYADRPLPGDITIPEKELSLLKSLRNQAILAIRQSL